MGVKSFFNYSMSSTPQTRADRLLDMLRGEREAFDEETALELIDRGIASKQAADMLTWAALRGRTSVVCALIDRKIVNVDARDATGDTALLNASYAGENETIEALHKRGASALLVNENVKCAFYFAESGIKPGTYQLLSRLYPDAVKGYEEKKQREARKLDLPTQNNMRFQSLGIATC